MHVILGVYVLRGIRLCPHGYNYVLGDMCPGRKCPGVICPCGTCLGCTSPGWDFRSGGGGGGASDMSPLSPSNGPRQHPGLKQSNIEQ